MTKNILIVNPVASIAYLAESFRAQNINTTALYTLDVVEEFVPADIKEQILSKQKWFDQQIYKESSDIKDLSEIFAKQYDFVLNGFEYSMPLTDQISNINNPRFANNQLNSKIRTYKYDTQEACKNVKSIKYINQCIVESDNFKNSYKLESILKDFTYPVFCKPENGAASIGISKINNFDELYNYFSSLNTSDSYIVQTFVDGVEFFVDTLSLEGKHYISFIGKYEKENINSVPVYRQGTLITDNEIWDKLTVCINDVLNTIEMMNGFSHAEFMIDGQNNIYLLEVNGRVSGGGGVHCKMANYAGLMSQDIMLGNFLKDEHVRSNYADDAIHNVASVDLFKFTSGYLKDFGNQLHEISSFKEILLYRKLNSYIKAPQQISLQDSIGCVILANHDSKQLSLDIEKVKLIEKTL